MKRIRLDHSATTPVRPEVLEAMTRLLAEGGNPSAMYASGRSARHALESAREMVAQCIGASPSEIFFTSGGTESDNWAIQGAGTQGIVTDLGEHHAVLHACAHMEEAGVQVRYAGLDARGMVSAEAVEEQMFPGTALVSVMHANNEVGTINPIARIAACAHAAGALMHTDAVASIGKIPVCVQDLGADLLSASAHKFYGPPGVGFLFVRAGTSIENLVYGGSQEKRRRPGTENVPGAYGLALALQLAEEERERTADRHRRQMAALRCRLEKNPGIRFCSREDNQLPGIVHFLLPGIRSEAALIQLDRRGFECAAGAACSQGAVGPSHVLLAMGIAPEEAACALRVSIGRDTQDEDLCLFAQAISDMVTVHNARGGSFAFNGSF